MLKLVLIWCAGGHIPNAAAQSDAFGIGPESSAVGELETDRDAFTPALSTAGRGLTILESSYTFVDNRSVAETHSFPELLFRRGLTERIELRFGWNFEVGGAGDLTSDTGGAIDFDRGEIERESQVLYGIKATLMEQDHWIPANAVILQGYTPTSGEDSATDFLAAYVVGWEFPNRWRLDSAVRFGIEKGVDDTFSQWAPSVVLRIPCTERWNAHVEFFGIFSDGAEEDFSRSFFSSGTHYLLTENLELGLRVGWGLTDDAPHFFSNIGVGWRF